MDLSSSLRDKSIHFLKKDQMSEIYRFSLEIHRNLLVKTAEFGKK